MVGRFHLSPSALNFLEGRVRLERDRLIKHGTSVVWPVRRQGDDHRSVVGFAAINEPDGGKQAPRMISVPMRECNHFHIAHLESQPFRVLLEYVFLWPSIKEQRAALAVFRCRLVEI
jgi:hypothetical protein